MTAEQDRDAGWLVASVHRRASAGRADPHGRRARAGGHGLGISAPMWGASCSADRDDFASRDAGIVRTCRAGWLAGRIGQRAVLLISLVLYIVGGQGFC